MKSEVEKKRGRKKFPRSIITVCMYVCNSRRRRKKRERMKSVSCVSAEGGGKRKRERERELFS